MTGNDFVWTLSEKGVQRPWTGSPGQCMEGLQLFTVRLRADRKWEILLHGGLWQQQGNRAHFLRGTLQRGGGKESHRRGK